MKPPHTPLTRRYLEYIISVDVYTSMEQAIKILKDINAYQSWTQLLTLSGRDPLMVGEDIQVQITADRKEEHFTAQIVLVEAHRFAARQILLAPWFFQAIHFFEIHPKTADQVTLVQRWEMRGLISKLFKRKIFETLSAFKQMNDDFKHHLESQLIPS